MYVFYACLYMYGVFLVLVVLLGEACEPYIIICMRDTRTHLRIYMQTRSKYFEGFVVMLLLGESYTPYILIYVYTPYVLIYAYTCKSGPNISRVSC